VKLYEKCENKLEEHANYPANDETYTDDYEITGKKYTSTVDHREESEKLSQEDEN
jgi:hypothetical protein